ncbi:MAG TPA: hypothetical protein DDZ91_11945 [Firmicutes bacterium]|jgi:hypothetical protein|nr:hypothetical protein [Bacillota bacterium]
MFVERKELEEAYLLAEKARMKLWAAINSPLSDDSCENDPATDIIQMVDTEMNDKFIKITINDILPRIAGLPKSNLEQHWLGIMHKALKDIKKKYKKVLCVIKVFSPAYYWDTDNRAYNIIINSLRYNQIIPNDKVDNLSFMVMGGVDKNNPRTEIYLVEHPENPLFFAQQKP